MFDQYGSEIFDVPQKTTIKQLENGQKVFTRMMYRRNNPHATVILPYAERLKIFEMDSLHQRRMIKDAVSAYDFLVANPNQTIDLYYSANSHHGFYSSKFLAKGKYGATHFSSRIATLLTNLKIDLRKYISSKQLRNHLSTMDLTDKKILKYVT